MALIGGMSTVLETYLFCESLMEDVWGDAIDMSDYFVDLKYPSLVRISMGETSSFPLRSSFRCFLPLFSFPRPEFNSFSLVLVRSRPVSGRWHPTLD